MSELQHNVVPRVLRRLGRAAQLVFCQFPEIVAEYCRYRLVRRKAAPPADPVHGDILKEMDSIGVSQLSLNELKTPMNDALWQSAREVFRHPEYFNGQSYYAGHLNIQELLKRPEIFLWGAQEPILKLAEAYLGVPVAYRGPYVQWDQPDGKVEGARVWHYDPEDFAVFKLAVYFNDVSSTAGPFEFHPRKQQSPRLQLRMLWFSDRELQAQGPPQNCTGSAGTVICFDGHSICHHGKMPTQHDRHVIFFMYHTRRPLRYTRRSWFTFLDLPQLKTIVQRASLTPYERDAVLWWEHLPAGHRPSYRNTIEARVY